MRKPRPRVCFAVEMHALNVNISRRIILRHDAERCFRIRVMNFGAVDQGASAMVPFILWPRWAGCVGTQLNQTKRRRGPREGVTAPTCADQRPHVRCEGGAGCGVIRL
jgi:hypothetical protein